MGEGHGERRLGTECRLMETREEKISRRGWFPVSNAAERPGRTGTVKRPLDLTPGLAGRDPRKDGFGAARLQG